MTQSATANPRPDLGGIVDLQAASRNRFDVPIPIQTSGSFGFGIGSK